LEQVEACSKEAVLRILVVDDERTVADTLGIILKQNNLEAKVAYSGETALNLARSSRPDWLVCDVILGGMTGIELAQRFAAEFPECRVILFSGQTVTADLLRTAEEGGHRFEVLAKPFHPQVLLDILSANGR
jgi:DNA-binding response OmpR family regulator